jgi:glycosyltransferase involved in cell wall biosynthesis
MDQSIQTQIEEIKEADILIGIPSYNNIRTIGLVIKSVIAGLGEYFPKERAVLFNSDGGSTDGTLEEVKKVQTEDIKIILASHPIPAIHKIITPYHGIPGKGSAFRLIFETASSLHAKACAVIDPDIKSITPEWMNLLLRPIYEGGFDYLAPLYARHKFDGTITNSIVYPLTRALYGKRIHQPIGEEFGFSGKLAKFCLTEEVWGTDIAQFGIDIWMATLAIAEGYKVCESYLGAKIRDEKDAGSDLGSMFSQVVSSVFSLIGKYENLWGEVKESHPVPTFGSGHERGVEPVSINLERMIATFRLGVKDLMDIWRKVLLPEAALWLGSLGRLPSQSFSVPQDLWVRIVYDFATAFHKGLVHHDHLLKSMIPLYLGWVASFVKENQEASAKEVEEKIESLCLVFEEMKPYLIERWGKP